MVAHLRYLASMEGDTKYARGVRHTSKKQQEMYKDRANKTFRKQMDMLSDLNPKNLHDLQEEMPVFTADFEEEEKKLPLTIEKRDPGLNATNFKKDI
jgi:hypothetical protein